MDIYREEILDHYHDPQNYHSLSQADLEVEISNPMCGDRQTWQLKLDKDKTITEIAFTGEGCALSIASASIVSEYMKGKKLDSINSLDAEQIFNLLKFKTGPARAKCVLLPLEALRKIKDKDNQ